jgi:hypothetical protein
MSHRTWKRSWCGQSASGLRLACFGHDDCISMSRNPTTQELAGRNFPERAF